MSGSIDIQVRASGLEELVKAMKVLPKNIQTNIMRAALKAGANLIADEARLRVPVKSGQLKASIRVSDRIVNGRPIVFVKAGSRETVYAIGKKAKATKDSYKYVKASGKTGYRNAYYVGHVEFGTAKMAARPFMRPAFEMKKRAAFETMAAYIRNRLPGEVEKLRAKNGGGK